MGFEVETKKILLSKVLVCQAVVVLGDLKRIVRVAASRRTALKYVGVRRDLVTGNAVAPVARRHDLHVAAVNLAIIEFHMHPIRSACAVYCEQRAALGRL